MRWLLKPSAEHRSQQVMEITRSGVYACVCVSERQSVYVSVCICVCMCMHAWERNVSEKVCVWDCVRVCVCLSEYVSEKERECVCIMCVCLPKRERLEASKDSNIIHQKGETLIQKRLDGYYDLPQWLDLYTLWTPAEVYKISLLMW